MISLGNETATGAPAPGLTPFAAADAGGGVTYVQGLASTSDDLAVRNVYPAPCQYAPGPAYIDPLPSLGGN